MEYVAPDARTIDNPVTNPGGTLIWATWQPVRVRGGSGDAGDTEAARMWAGRAEVQFPAIDDNFNQLVVLDDDFITDDQGSRFNIENPLLSPDNSFWSAVLDRVR